jgi:four helix bundle protein
VQYRGRPGTLLEIEAQLVIATDLRYLDEGRAEQLIEQAIEVTKKVNALIRSYEDD